MILRKLYTDFEEYCCVAAISVMIIALALQIIFRGLFGGGLAWSEELSRFSFVWTTFLGMSLAAKRVSHVRITAGLLLLSIKARLVVRVLMDALWICASFYIAYHGLELIQEGLEFPEVSPTLRITKAWIEAVIPFSFAITPLRILEQYGRAICNGTLAELVNEGVAP